MRRRSRCRTPDLVGRAAELRVLRAAAAEADGGRARFVLVEGAGGAGRSALLRVFVDGLPRGTVLRAVAHPEERELPFAVLDVLEARIPPDVRRGRATEGGEPLRRGAELLAVLDALQSGGPVVVVVDDAHEIDAASAQALLFVVRRLHHHRVLVLLAARPEPVPALAGWRRFVAEDDHAVRLVLAGLDAAAVRELAVAVHGEPIPAGVAERLVQHTAGRALYVRAMLEALPAADLAADRPLPAPPLVTALTRAALASLGPAARAVAAAAALLGDRPRLDDVARVSGVTELTGPVGELDRASLLTLGTDGELEWAAPVVRAAVAGDVTPGSGWPAAGAAMSTPFDAEAVDEDPAVLEALAEVLPAGPHRLVATGLLALRRGEIAAADRALHVAWQDHDRTGEPGLRLVVADAVAVLRLVQGRGRDAAAWAGRVLAAGSEQRTGPGRACGVIGRAISGAAVEQDAGDPSDLDVLAARGLSRLWAGDERGAVADLRAAGRGRRAGATIRFAEIAEAHLAYAAYRSGAWDDADLHADLAVGLARDARRGWALPVVHALAAYPAAARGRFTEAEQHLAAASAGATDPEQRWGRAAVLAAQAHLAWCRGEPEAVLAAGDALGDDTSDWARPWPERAPWPLYRVDALLDLGRLAQARRELGELAARPATLGVAGVRLHVDRLRVRVAAAGDPGRALAAGRAALRRGAAADPPHEVALLEIETARQALAAGRRRAAAELLVAARERLRGLGARPALEVCGSLLGEPGPARPGPGGNGAAVAALAAAGLTNRQIAEELFLSPHTVDYHLRRLYARYGVRSRGELGRAMQGEPPNATP